MVNLRKILENSFVADAEHHASIASTNDQAIAAASEPGVRLPLLVLADVQTAGRGRGSNRWWTGQGSLAFSLLLNSVGWDKRASANAGPPDLSTGGPALARSELVPPYEAQRPPPLISLAVGVALVDALAPLAPGHEIGIHWPNDVMLDGRKLAGILIEVLPGGKQVIGIGANTNNSSADAPAEVRARVTTLRDATGCEHDSTDLLIAILNRLEERLAELASSPEKIAARTNELCLQHGMKVHVRHGAQEVQGVCQGIAVDGALRLQTGGQLIAIYSGTVTVA